MGKKTAQTAAGAMPAANRSAQTGSKVMTTVTNEVMEHDGGWAYKVDDIFSETFATHTDVRRSECVS